tara:strand:+ start:7397 stop:9475 length:2079 start_codon:yes stop_codon:yes gene_type:complete
MGESSYITGPWKGLEWRETYQTPQHDDVSINVEYSKGYKESRPGLCSPKGDGLSRVYVKVLDPVSGTGKSLGGPTEPRMKEVKLYDGSKGILCIGPGAAWTETLTIHGAPHTVVRPNGDIMFVVFDLDLNIVSSGNLSYPDGIYMNQPQVSAPDEKWQCSFLDLYSSDRSQKMVAVVSTTGTWVWDPLAKPTNPAGGAAPPWPYFPKGYMREVELPPGSSADFGYLYDASRLYFSTLPACSISVFHNDLAYYAGFRDDSGMSTQTTIEEAQDNVNEAKLQVGRKGVRMDPQDFLVSDPAVPFSIHTDALFNLDLGEKVTGLQPVGESLLVFSTRSIYSINGDPVLQESTISKVADGVGCTSPHSVVAAEGAVYFMSYAGIHRFFQGQVENISVGISELWTGQQKKTRLPEEAKQIFDDLDYPWRVDVSRLDRVTAVHLFDRKQIWWSLPIEGNSEFDSRPVALVFDYANGAFSLYTSRDAFIAGGVRNQSGTFFSDGIQIETGGRLRTFFCCRASNTGASEIVELDSRPWDSGGRSIPMVWQSGRIGGGNVRKLSFRKFRFDMLAWGRQNLALALPRRGRAFFEGDEVTFDKMLAGEIVADADRQLSAVTVDGHPRQDNTYFFDDAANKFNVGVFSERAFFESRCDPKSIASKYLHIGVIEDRDADTGQAGKCNTVIRGFFVDVNNEGRGRR